MASRLMIPMPPMYLPATMSEQKPAVLIIPCEDLLRQATTKKASIGTLHAPGKPLPTTAEGATASSLIWSIPADINNDTLQFRIEVEEKYNDLSFVKIIDQTTLSDSSRFSGTKPYAQGTGSVTYTILAATFVSGKTYRWRITAQKNPDATVTSLPSEWRAFVYA